MERQAAGRRRNLGRKGKRLAEELMGSASAGFVGRRQVGGKHPFLRELKSTQVKIMISGSVLNQGEIGSRARRGEQAARIRGSFGGGKGAQLLGGEGTSPSREISLGDKSTY